MSEVDTVAEMQRVIAFVNTLDPDDSSDDIDTPDSLAAWLRGQGLLGAGDQIGAADVAAAHGLREALRVALLAHDGHGAAETAPDTAVAAVPLQLVIYADGSTSVTAGAAGTAPALARLVAAIPAAAADGAWWRTKACPQGSCQWAFYDRSRNRSRRWCSMEVCGNREKTRTFRERRRD
jgi:predicted RNA-binding Zn ribbon-like protein